MSLEALYRDFNDLNFRSLKVLRLEKIDNDIIKDYILFVGHLKSELTKWIEDSILLEKVEQIIVPDFNFEPKLNIGVNFLGFLSFKIYTKLYREKARLNYFKNLTKHNKDLTQYISLRINH